MDGNMGPPRETQNQKEKGPEPTAPTPFYPRGILPRPSESDRNHLCDALLGGGSARGFVRRVVEGHTDFREADFAHSVAALTFLDHQCGVAAHRRLVSLGQQRGHQLSVLKQLQRVAGSHALRTEGVVAATAARLLTCTKRTERP